MKIEAFKKLKLPDKPGVYFFKRGKEILYIGKATSLRDRVKSYFGQDLIENRGPVLVDMVFQADDIKWQETDSVLEALILEASLIKKYQPKYNTKEKSDKSFNYVCITKEKLPRVVILRGKDIQTQKGAFSQVLGFLGPQPQPDHSKKHPFVFSEVFGPFPHGSQLREAMKIIRRIFPFLDDKSKNYLEFYKQINLLPDLNDRQIYLQNIRNIKLFFVGKKKRILQNLKKEMGVYAKAREFEKAGEIKRQIFALQHINDVALLAKEDFTFSQVLGSPRHSDSNLGMARPDHSKKQNLLFPFRIEAYDIAHMSGKNMVGVMVVLEDGQVAKNEYRKFKVKTQEDSNDTGALREILVRRFTHQEWRTPDLVVVDGGIPQLHTAKSVLKEVGISIPTVSVLKDERHKPKEILGDKEIVKKYKRDILLANNEAHRFAITYHKKTRARNFLE